MSSIVNKIKEAVHSDKSATHNTHTTGTHSEGATGPHNSRVANAADPRVDSDRDGSSTIGGAGRTAGMTGSHGLGTSGTTGGFGNTHGTAEGTHGPHSSRLANAADPRVDSDRDGSNTMGGAGRTAGMTGSHGLGTSGVTGSHNTGAFGSSNRGTAEGIHGPHSSRLANAADPRVDSDRDGSNTIGNTGRSTGTHGIGSTGHTGAFGSGPGPASNTAGPHNSDMMNKFDPRVDSDLDGSKTMGGNKTYQ